MGACTTVQMVTQQMGTQWRLLKWMHKIECSNRYTKLNVLMGTQN